MLIAAGIIVLLAGLSLFAYDRTYQQQTIVLFISGVLIVLGCLGLVRTWILGSRSSAGYDQN